MRRRGQRAARRPRARILGALAACALVSGCATWSSSFQEVEFHLAQQRYTEALLALEQQNHVGRDEVLYLLNKGMILRMDGDFRASNEAFEAAKALMEEFSTASLSEQTARFIINDAAHAYAGEEHEQVLVHLYLALNYIALGDLDNARVEALQVDLTLQQQAERAGPGRNTEDAFARYLNGMIYEDLGEWSDAMIAYRKSYQAYLEYRKRYALDVPQALKIDLLRLAGHLGLNSELRRYQETFQIAHWQDFERWRDQGELVLLLHNGLAPIKREESTATVDPGSGHIVRISLPYYEARAPVARAARVIVGEREARTEVFEDVAAIAIQRFQAKMPAIVARTIARAAIKGKISDELRRSASKQEKVEDALAAAIVGFGVELAGVLTERADTRSWATLPHDIQLARLTLPPGSYTIKVEVLGFGDQPVGAFEVRDVAIRPGRKTYLSRHWTPAYALAAPAINRRSR